MYTLVVVTVSILVGDKRVLRDAHLYKLGPQQVKFITKLVYNIQICSKWMVQLMTPAFVLTKLYVYLFQTTSVKTIWLWSLYLAICQS